MTVTVACPSPATAVGADGVPGATFEPNKRFTPPEYATKMFPSVWIANELTEPRPDPAAAVLKDVSATPAVENRFTYPVKLPPTSNRPEPSSRTTCAVLLNEEPTALANEVSSTPALLYLRRYGAVVEAVTMLPSPNTTIELVVPRPEETNVASSVPFVLNRLRTPPDVPTRTFPSDG